ncbi:MAG TPA: hypothetical protein VH088_08775 [Terriglobales bacterium]|nr:hypothetical protein [Terriglobales bacterium]
MKTVWFCCLFILLAPAAFADGVVEITEVGLKGYYAPSVTLPVRARIAVPEGVSHVDLQYSVTNGSIDAPGNPLRTDRFSMSVSVTPGQLAEVDSPLVSSSGNDLKIDLTAVAQGGRVLGNSRVAPEAINGIADQTFLVMLCGERKLCDSIQSQISFSGTEDETSEKNRNYKFLALDHPRNRWWEYSIASMLIIADPVARWSAEEQEAAEFFVRSGGQAIFLTSECGETTFLEAYRKDAPAGKWVSVGKGRLLSVARVQDKLLPETFRVKQGQSFQNRQELRFFQMGLDFELWVLRQVGVAFTFPRLRWILLWIAVYILTVGLANFSLLRRLKKVEWGWLTSGGLAILFALGFFFVNSAKRPKQVTLDNITTYWLDSRSGTAFETVSLRVSSPRAQSIGLRAGDAAATYRSQYRSNTPDAEIGRKMIRQRYLAEGTDIDLGPPEEVHLALLRWSLMDTKFETFHKFAGSVDHPDASHLVNQTGVAFPEAVYLDFDKNQQFQLGAVAPGQTIDLKAMQSAPIWREENFGQYSSHEFIRDSTKNKEDKGFFLSDMRFASSLQGGAKHLFVAKGGPPVDGAKISTNHVIEQKLSVTIVSLDQP